VVSLKNGSWMTTKSRSFIPFSSFVTLGSEMMMSSPMMNSALMPSPTVFIITLRFIPGSGDSLTPQEASYLACTSG